LEWENSLGVESPSLSDTLKALFHKSQAMVAARAEFESSLAENLSDEDMLGKYLVSFSPCVFVECYQGC
jgi:hypothetical protein